jgi:acetyl esterase/lipase
MIDLRESVQKRVVYTLPGMEAVTTRKDLTYKTIAGTDLKMDLYYPANFQGKSGYPAVILVHGDGPAELLRDAKEWGVFVSLGQLLATQGVVAITFNHRATDGWTKLDEVASDIDDLVHAVREQAASLQVEKDSLCLWAFSAGAPFGLRAALRNAPAYIRCIVSYYGLLSLQPLRPILPETVTDTTLRELSPICYLENDAQNIAPLFIVKAGLDRPDLNSISDSFISRAFTQNVSITAMNHATGHHSFDILDDNERSREIIKQTLDFIRTHLEKGSHHV